MKKNITAIILVFTLLLSFAACRRLNSENIIIQSKAYYVDDEGVTRDIYDSGSGYFYFDENGNKISADEKDVVIETNKVVITEPSTFTPEAQSYLDSFGGADTFEEALGADATQPQLEIDELIPEDTFEDITVELGPDGRPVHSGASYEEILSSETFTINVNIKAKTAQGESTVPLKMVRNGDNLYCETAMPLENGTGSARLNIILLDGDCYVVMPSMRAYMEIPKEQIGEMIPEQAFAPDDEIKGTYISSGRSEYDGVTYVCDIYEYEGATSKYFYENDVLKRIETKTPEGNESIYEIKEMSTNADPSLFAVPKNYFDISEMLGEDYDISNII